MRTRVQAIVYQKIRQPLIDRHNRTGHTSAACGGSLTWHYVSGVGTVINRAAHVCLSK